MPRVPADHYFYDICTHAVDLPPESCAPRGHYRRHANDAWNLIEYVDRNLDRTNVYETSRDRHMRRLHGMVLVRLVAAFELFLKEVAAICVDHVATAVTDDRLDIFSVKGQALAVHFHEGCVGKALCESVTWLDCKEINDRFRRILMKPHDPNRGKFYVFPGPNQQPEALRGKRDVMTLIFQLRHAIVHNAGVLTHSDAAKLSRIVRRELPSPRLLWPEKNHVRYVKLFLDDLVERINLEVGTALADVMSMFHGAVGGALAKPGGIAQELSNAFQTQLTVGGQTCNPE